MISFSVNKQVDLSEVDLMPRDGKQHWIGREWASTLYQQCVEGSKGLKPVVPSLDAYAYACEENTKLKKFKEAVPIISEEELEAGHKGVVLEQLSTYAVQKSCSLDLTFEDEDEYNSMFEEFVSMRELIYLDMSVDYANLLLQAYRCAAPAVEALQKLHEEYKRLDEITKTIVKCPHWLDDIVAVLHKPIISQDD